MPEGDTIFRTARALARVLVGRPITAFRSNYPLLTRSHDNQPLIGERIDQVESRGKWLLIFFSGGRVLVTHMRMSGSWHIYRPGERWRRPGSEMRVVLENSLCQAVGFLVPVAEMHTMDSLIRDRRIPPREADLLSTTFDMGAAAVRVRACAGEEIGNVLLHQDVLAGVGNVFKSEVCFVAGIHPFAVVSALTDAQIEALVRASQRLLAANVLEPGAGRGAERRTTRFADPAASLWVYGRSGAPCRRCGEPVHSSLQGSDVRRTYWCPRCQPMPAGAG